MAVGLADASSMRWSDQFFLSHSALLCCCTVLSIANDFTLLDCCKKMVIHFHGKIRWERSSCYLSVSLASFSPNRNSKSQNGTITATDLTRSKMLNYDQVFTCDYIYSGIDSLWRGCDI